MDMLQWQWRCGAQGDGQAQQEARLSAGPGEDGRGEAGEETAETRAGFLPVQGGKPPLPAQKSPSPVSSSTLPQAWCSRPPAMPRGQPLLACLACTNCLPRAQAPATCPPEAPVLQPPLHQAHQRGAGHVSQHVDGHHGHAHGEGSQLGGHRPHADRVAGGLHAGSRGGASGAVEAAPCTCTPCSMAGMARDAR